ncbi:Protein of unknown function [Cotesia congregata]|uniref:Uncharacterized protein n=1 Tax=Cotesia congregata TaxID=51543 RepID=A0A8J2HBI3_COTCN|nr:Protein of unknown function [Cotesia congregata]
MNSPNKNRNITKTQLTEKLKADIDILTNDLKKTLTNLENLQSFFYFKIYSIKFLLLLRMLSIGPKKKS